RLGALALGRRDRRRLRLLELVDHLLQLGLGLPAVAGAAGGELLDVGVPELDANLGLAHIQRVGDVLGAVFEVIVLVLAHLEPPFLSLRNTWSASMPFSTTMSYRSSSMVS